MKETGRFKLRTKLSRTVLIGADFRSIHRNTDYTIELVALGGMQLLFQL